MFKREVSHPRKGSDIFKGILSAESLDCLLKQEARSLKPSARMPIIHLQQPVEGSLHHLCHRAVLSPLAEGACQLTSLMLLESEGD